MQFYGPFLVLLAILVQVRCVRRITLDDDSQALCKKYKMMCKTDKICAVQHFDWPSNITIPVCIPMSYVPVRNMICKLPPDTGRCLARYIRWYYNIHSQGCTHFQYGGCEGNQNNFMSKSECEQTCVSTPSIRLYESGHSALVQPSIVTAPKYEPPRAVNTRVEALNSVREPVAAGSYDRYEISRRRPNKSRTDEASITRTRRRLDKEREKERKRREKKKEKKRLKKLRREQRKMRCKKRRERGKRCKKERKDKKKKSSKRKSSDKNSDVDNDVESELNEIVKSDSDNMVEETKKLINNEIDAMEVEEDEDKDKKRDRLRKKRKLRDKRRHETERSRRNLNNRKSRKYSEYSKKADSYSKKLFSILDDDRQYPEQENSLIHTLS